MIDLNLSSRDNLIIGLGILYLCFMVLIARAVVKRRAKDRTDTGAEDGAPEGAWPTRNLEETAP